MQPSDEGVDPAAQGLAASASRRLFGLPSVARRPGSSGV